MWIRSSGAGGLERRLLLTLGVSGRTGASGLLEGPAEQITASGLPLGPARPGVERRLTANGLLAAGGEEEPVEDPKRILRRRRIDRAALHLASRRPA